MPLSRPSASVAPSVETIFINGVKFDICEVDKSCYNMLYDPAAGKNRFRFFICCEDNILGFKNAEDFYNTTKQERWDFFCSTKAEARNKIMMFDVYCKKFEYYTKLKAMHPNLFVQDKIDSCVNYCLANWGHKPVLSE